MKRLFISIGIIVALSAMAGFIILNKPDNQHMDNAKKSTSQQLVPAENEIFMQDFAYTPKVMTIKKGTTVTWTNQDDARHDISPDTPSEAFEASELLSKGESYSYTFNTVGTYDYHCSPHPYMKATIEVTE